MKISKNKNNKKIILITIIVIVAITAGYLAFAYSTKRYPFEIQVNETGTDKKVNKVDYKAPSEEQKNAPTEQKSPKKPQTSPSNESPNPPQSVAPTEPVSTDRVVITSQDITPDGSLEVRTLIQAVTTEGSCAITVTKNAKVVHQQTAGVQAMSGSSTCKGFTVPAASVGSGGVVQVSIEYSNSKGVSSTSGEVSVP